MLLYGSYESWTLNKRTQYIIETTEMYFKRVMRASRTEKTSNEDNFRNTNERNRKMVVEIRTKQALFVRPP